MNRRARFLLPLPALFIGVLSGSGFTTPAPAAAAETTVERVPFTDDFDACTGERVSITGVQTVVGRITQDGDGKWHFGFTRNTRGDGVGASGARYILNDAVARHSIEITLGVPKTFTEEYSGRFVRAGETGSADDSFVHFLSSVTVDATGAVHSSVTIQKAECK